jgi:hypothetical protein
MQFGLSWLGVELEEKFVRLGNQNIALWNSRYAGKLPMWGTAQLLQGDSRNLAEIVRGASGVISSPPFSEFTSSGRGAGIVNDGITVGKDGHIHHWAALQTNVSGAGGDINSDGQLELIVGKSGGSSIRIYKSFADNSYAQVWGDSTTISRNAGMCLINTNATPEQEIAVVDDIKQRFFIFGRYLYLKQRKNTRVML